MITFKQFLESESPKAIWEIKPRVLTKDEMVEWIKTHSSQYIKGELIWRGIKGERGTRQGLYNTASMRRSAANTFNYYNLWLCNHPAWENFPRRDKSFIGSTAEYTARGYGHKYLMVVKDTADIGVCPKLDIWHSFTPVYKITEMSGMDAFMTLTNAISDIAGISGPRNTDWHLFQKCMRYVTPERLRAAIPNWSKQMRDYAEHFLEFMDQRGCKTAYEVFEKIFDPTDFQIQKGSSVKTNGNNEVWTAGEILLIHDDNWPDIRSEFL